jgi:2,4-dienoyl-CoA reductase-like NADH-dependent reductase (Old Yellow Enzyme family)
VKGNGLKVLELFETTEINGMQLKNRFVRSATWTGLAGEDGTCSRRLIDRMVALTKGGVGLIVTGHAYVQKNGQAGPWQLGIDRDKHIPRLRDLTDTIHGYGGKIVIQLAHAGIYGDPKLTGETPFTVSNGAEFVSYPTREMTSADIDGVVTAFDMAAQRARAAGYDAIQLHAAHGYLLSQFLSPAYNKRDDRHGGNVEGRALVLLQIIRRIRKSVGTEYPILIKMNSRDFMKNGLELNDSVKAGVLFENAGIDAIEISGGTRESGKLKSSRPDIVSENAEAYFEDASRTFKNHVTVPLIVGGGIRSFCVAEKLVNDRAADYIAISRPLIREPGLIKRWQSGDHNKAACISDNRCLTLGLLGKGIHCCH